MNRRFTAVRCALLFLLLCVVTAAHAQSPVGNVHLREGITQIGRDGAWIDAAAGADLFEGDSLRTGASSRLQVLFRDASMLTLGENSTLVIDQQLFDPPKGLFDSSFRLLEGKVRAFASDYYRKRDTRFEVETLTATTGVRGTEFLVIYDAQAKVTEAIGVNGTISVHSVLDRARRGVLVTAGEITSVRQGYYPTPPRKLDAEAFRQYLEGLTMATVGSAESLSVYSQSATGDAVPTEDTAPVVIQEAGPIVGAEDTAGGPQAPGDVSPENKFEDVTNSGTFVGDLQPPGPSESTRARVDF